MLQHPSNYRPSTQTKGWQCGLYDPLLECGRTAPGSFLRGRQMFVHSKSYDPRHTAFKASRGKINMFTRAKQNVPHRAHFQRCALIRRCSRWGFSEVADCTDRSDSVWWRRTAYRKPRTTVDRARRSQHPTPKVCTRIFWITLAKRKRAYPGAPHCLKINRTRRSGYDDYVMQFCYQLPHFALVSGTFFFPGAAVHSRGPLKPKSPHRWGRYYLH